MRLRDALAMLALLMLPALQAARAQSLTPYEYDQIRDRIKRTGNAPVRTVVLPLLETLGMKPDVLAATIQRHTDAIVAELGSEVLPGGRQVYSWGSVVLWVTEPGLEILRNSRLPVKLGRGPEWNAETLLSQSDGYLEEVGRRLRRDGKVDVEVTVDVAGAEFDIDRHTGESTLLLKTPQQQSLAVQSALAVLASLGVPLSTGLPASSPGEVVTVLDVGGVERNGTMVLRANEQGLGELAWNRAVIAIKAAGHMPMSAPIVSAAREPSNDEAAGQLKVALSLKYPYPALSLGSARSALHMRMLGDVLAPYNIIGTPQWLEAIGLVYVVLSDADLERLIQSRDLRLQHLQIDKPGDRPARPQ